MKTALYTLALIGLSAGLGACATVTRGTTTSFAVESSPPGAAVKTSTGFSCAATPCSMKMPRKEAFEATVTKAGYAPMTVHVDSSIGAGGGAGFAGNIVAGGILGMGIDAASGAMDDLKPNPLKVTLAAEGAAPAPVQPTATAGPADAPATPPAPAPQTQASNP